MPLPLLGSRMASSALSAACLSGMRTAISPCAWELARLISVPAPPMTSRPPVFLLAGPTASGKTALSLRLAEALGAEVVNADAIQLYRDLRILSARPSAEEEARAPHHLFGVADAGDGWSVGRWLTAATKALDEIASRGRPAIVVGGTG